MLSELMEMRDNISCDAAYSVLITGAVILTSARPMFDSNVLIIPSLVGTRSSNQSQWMGEVAGQVSCLCAPVAALYA